MKIIAGLGNPGREYEKTKHNIGFMTADLLAERLGISVTKLKFRALIGEGRIGNEKVIIMKPQTYMNLSGESVREILNFYKLDPEDLIVIYDDIDIPVGSLRIRAKGSAGTHNGMRSVVSQIKSENFPRVRVGIGSEHRGDLVDYVISGFSSKDRESVRSTIEKAADAVECIVKEGVSSAMNKYNTKKPKKKKKAAEAQKDAHEEAQENDKTAQDRRPSSGPDTGIGQPAEQEER